MSRGVALRLLGACLVAVLAGGLLGMHTLGLHGTAHGGHSSDAVHAASDGHHAGPADRAADHQEDGGPADGTAMACLFLLVTLGALLLLPRTGGGLRGGLGLPRPPPLARLLPVLVVDRRPPPVHAWSVVRC
ncbi:hypothetical protein [uncultured Nocardioides sp.]|uniref:hypothetical protein n=1 Tax=uncultured Nocardioides sp. TaxID=198441 RepID=UPI0026283AB7|nr:hypothetical protein [uncultured Nocardioides sp.]